MGVKNLGGLEGIDTLVVMPLFERMWQSIQNIHLKIYKFSPSNPNSVYPFKSLVLCTLSFNILKSQHSGKNSDVRQLNTDRSNIPQDNMEREAHRLCLLSPTLLPSIHETDTSIFILGELEHLLHQIYLLFFFLLEFVLQWNQDQAPAFFALTYCWLS